MLMAAPACAEACGEVAGCACVRGWSEVTGGGGNLSPCLPPGQVQRGAGAPPRRAPRRPRGPRLLQPRPEQKHNEGGGMGFLFLFKRKKKKKPQPWE